MKEKHTPEILAPAGGPDAFLAALAAGADAVYCGLKNFSARMEADNFSLKELARLTELAHSRGTRVHVTFNTLLKPDEAERVGHLVENLQRYVHPDALIIQDLGVLRIARMAGFEGGLHFSTLANVCSPSALASVHKLGATRAVLPRELNIDEVRQMAANTPENLELEVFIHGALCYAVSGRCYWSSFLGGRSGLRGRCVQPCRRQYEQFRSSCRFFSCSDLSLDVLTRPLCEISQVSSWKIEGRKKGPHYVFYTVKAYQLLRDHGDDPKARKMAEEYLSQSLGRKSGHYLFLPQRPKLPFDQEQTGSGLQLGVIRKDGKKTYFMPRQPLLSGDLLRIGYSDQPWHFLYKVRRALPRGGRLDMRLPSRPAPKGTPVFLVDRREPELLAMMQALEQELAAFDGPDIQPSSFCPKPVQGMKIQKNKQVPVQTVCFAHHFNSRYDGAWLDLDGKFPVGKVWHWLPPVIWPREEKKWQECIARIQKRGGGLFVLNAPWQIELFERVPAAVWAGPFCNIANAHALLTLKEMGFSGAIVSPELSSENMLALPKMSPLPLGIVLAGFWPLALARIVNPELKQGEPFVSPKKEQAWAIQHDNLTWVYPNWRLDLGEKKRELANAGYSLFVTLDEKVPRSVELRKRPGLWNWDLQLL